MGLFCGALSGSRPAPLRPRDDDHHHEVITGPWVQAGTRPAQHDPPVCSFRHPLCVHAARGENSRAQLEALASAERAWDLAVGPLALPAPDPSPSTRAYDLYLVDAAPGASTTMTDERDVRSSFDRASACW